MVAVAEAVPATSGDGEERLAKAMQQIAEKSDGPDFEELIAKRDELLALA
jgi:hypothetical protein